MSSTASRGRRPAGGGDARADILAAARTAFAEKGHAGTTIRAVAADAGVDPALVHHYFGTKDDLFVAALEFPLDPRELISAVGAGGVDGLGERLLTVFLDVWEQPEDRLPLLALARSAVAGEPGRSLLETLLTRFVFGTLGERLDLDQPDRRLGLVASQMMGIVMGRYLVAIEPLASMPRDQLVAAVAPTLQRYLTGPLS